MLRLKNAMPPNKPLMAYTEHWKSKHVLPMFPIHPLAFDPGFRMMRA
jgi:hypothetical protein